MRSVRSARNALSKCSNSSGSTRSTATARCRASKARMPAWRRARPVAANLRRLIAGAFIDAGGNTAEAILLAGTQRSGTTWIADVIDYDGRYRYMYEPFNARRVPLAAAFPYGTYLRPDDVESEHVNPARAILSGRMRHPAVDRTFRRPYYRRRLIKETYANLFLAWLHARFPDVRIALLLRHPCAVAASKVRLGWASMLPELREQPQLIADHLAPFSSVIDSAADAFEEHIVNWCIQTYVPLRQLKGRGVHVCFYEEFCGDGRAAAERLFSYFGRPIDERVTRALATPSFSAGADSD